MFSEYLFVLVFTHYRTAYSFSEASQQSGGKSIASDLILTYSGTNDVEWSPSSHCGLNTPPPPESTPTSIPHTPIQQVSPFSVKVGLGLWS